MTPNKINTRIFYPQCTISILAALIICFVSLSSFQYDSFLILSRSVMSRLLRHLICISCAIIHLNGEFCTEERRMKLFNFDATRRNNLFVTNVSCSINYFDVSIVNGATWNVIHSRENLRSLDLSNNRINEIQNETFINFTSLETLRLHNNFMTEIHDQHFKYLKELSGLDLSSNLIEAISFRAFEKLQSLLWVNIADNCLHNVALYFPLRALHSLNIAQNRINRFPQLSGIISKITNLNLSHNLIVDLQLTKALSIESLSIADNQLKDLNQLSQVSGLIELNLADNRNVDFTTNDKFIRHLAGYRKLNLTNTNLTSLDVFRYVSGTNFIELSLSQNPLVTDFKELSKFSNLERLEFQQKFCSDFDSYRTIRRSFKNLKSVKILYDESLSCKCIKWNRMQFKFEDIDYQTDWSVCENDPDCGQSMKFNVIVMAVTLFVIFKFK